MLVPCIKSRTKEPSTPSLLELLLEETTVRWMTYCFLMWWNFRHSFYSTFFQANSKFTDVHAHLIRFFMHESYTCRTLDQALMSVGAEGGVKITAMQPGLECWHRAGNTITALHVYLTVRHPRAGWEI